MRGKENSRSEAENTFRITPAYAGKSREDLKHGLAKKDHPRLCGEKVTMRYIVIPIVGSPPPMRGKVTPANTQSIPDRITPAYAGKSLSATEN